MIEFIAIALPTAAFTFVGLLVGVPILLGLLRALCIYTIVEERKCYVITLFGPVIAVLDKPGLIILPFAIGPRFILIPFFGELREVDLTLDQVYVRSQPVNSEEGAPMGIGVWYEMFVSNPVDFLFKNTDPRGSLRANVSNAVVRCLSNLSLDQMLENRHNMSQAVRSEVTEKSQEWGYKLGSVYIRKVHFRDTQMIEQIEEKVVNRLRQVTAAILQDGANQVNVITSSAERQAAIEFARAAAMRPQIVGAALNEINQDPDVLAAMFKILETERLLKNSGNLTLMPRGGMDETYGQVVAAETIQGGHTPSSTPTPGDPGTHPARPSAHHKPHLTPEKTLSALQESLPDVPSLQSAKQKLIEGGREAALHMAERLFKRP